MKSLIAAAGLVLSLTIAPAAHAQSGGDSETDGFIDDAATAEPAAPSPIAVDGLTYLRMSQAMPFGLWELRFAETMREYRLGIVPPDATQEQLQELDTAARVVAGQLQQITPPAELAQVHELNISAASEYAAAFQSSMDALNGNDSAYDTAYGHFDRAEAFASEARQRLR